MMNQYPTFLRRSVGLTTLAVMLSWAVLVDALGLKLFGGKPPHHGKVSFNRGGADCLIADSSDKEMSIAFCSVRFAPLLSRHCCIQSWLTPQTKQSRNILSNESPYLLYWLNLLNSAIYCEMLSPNFLLHMLKTNYSRIGFLLEFSWFVIKVTSSMNVLSIGFLGVVF